MQTLQSIQSIKRPSDRKFGFTFAVIFVAAGIYGPFASWSPLVYWLCGLAGASLSLVAAIAPPLLHPLNRAWLAFGEILGRVVSPLALGLIFYALITPVSVITRLCGRDELHLKRRAASSYWLLRQAPIPKPDSFKQQF